ncbi:PilT protein domain protein [Stanieria cyanosphaera PCC 7437]|uniref:PilT protein domain protein n=1 Tax=Stanieria cyanosphaera (strain ATCC 29371 / PCC 7437) TaxID=111780 RepID=K9XSP4_STAC7|nr:type II toxin-antitoxin system VapC family toxin [Stanieria cyanosphaera]AFZ35086.1 PilT protein domain protein [Stanieria cyanosphaera PCC 7437]
MRILLDTHIFLWLIEDNKRLSDRYRQAIQNPNNEKFLSVVSIWECVIKYQIGKLNFPSSPEIYLPMQRREHLIKTINVDENSIAQLINLPLVHGDPFDRLIIAQALQYDLVIMTQDKAILAYPEIRILPNN